MASRSFFLDTKIPAVATQHVLIGFLIATVLLTIATMYPYLKHRIPELREENARADAQHARHD